MINELIKVKVFKRELEKNSDLERDYFDFKYMILKPIIRNVDIRFATEDTAELLDLIKLPDSLKKYREVVINCALLELL